MKKFFYFVLILIALLYISVKVFQNYKENNLLKNEAVVNIYFNLPEEEIDSYFGLEKGTFDKTKHTILCSFQKQNNYLLDYYYNLSIYNGTDLINCDEKFSIEKHRRFKKYDINSSTMIVRLVNIRSSNNYSANISNSIIAKKEEYINIGFGKINNIILDKNGASHYCH
ncbi:hypothetical protein LXD69_14755 [Flavobacterium sediminilitoris]|uniref:Uncharacterized protein n=1 Tax=Flavobacterium sediminilitoris TaxID=2024526 RepID=A0ABY4HKW1_9FLAO|nr:MULTISPECIES: hypothetical protein [Flavobacterium]UOX33291.1 hypothetical protein LXD69_14755 [Flavobacterium sediminilitoris]